MIRNNSIKKYKMKSKTLHLTLKKEWFDMIKSGEKKEEYKDIVPYWTKRLCEKNDKEDVYEISKFDDVEFTLGYPKKDDLDKRIESLENK